MEFTTKYALTTRIDGKFVSNPNLLGYVAARTMARDLSAAHGRAYGVVECQFVEYDALAYARYIEANEARATGFSEEAGIALAEELAYGEFCGCGACHECNIGGCEAYYLGVEEVCSHFTHDRDGNGVSVEQVVTDPNATVWK
jgi:hypothetical protein